MYSSRGNSARYPDTTQAEPRAKARKDTSFLEENWPIIAICCVVVLIICVVACLVKVLCTRNKSQPPDDYVNLTSDRAVNYPAQTVPNRTMPKIQSNYCNPKDLQTRRSNIEPNYSEVKESQGEGLYAELNRPEDTYAEPYIDKNELYAQPIPKAERRRKDDPSYGNVFGQDYVNSRK
ncbi:hypothetical protein MSG28_015423 [Choristoneura fumiferana]|uniref:Uncharacterized protein n=1 Tax=Choristoneura fumiferana TaxID=7141 RepID=A0ACC0KA76_CHOFU|nr:hypothetical protein MSG28_015423 [Choristoneura fumiferana]